jgi:hypothetical protein
MVWPTVTRAGEPAIVISTSPSSTLTSASKRRGVLAQFLAGIEGEDGDISAFLLQQDAADHRAALIADQIDKIQNF